MIRNGMQVETMPRGTTGSTQTLPKFVLVAAAGLTLGFAIFLLSAIAGMQLGNTLLRPSPFIPYEAIWPGQGMESLETYAGRLPEAITCTSPSPNSPYFSRVIYHIPGDAILSFELICSYAPAGGLFRWVTARAKSGHIQQLELISDVLSEDVLLLYWGMPDAISRMGSDQRLNLFWERGSYSVMATVMEATSTVRIVTLTANF